MGPPLKPRIAQPDHRSPREAATPPIRMVDELRTFADDVMRAGRDVALRR